MTFSVYFLKEDRILLIGKKGDMKEYGNTLIMFMLVMALLLSIFLAYRFLYHAYEISHEQERKILFYKLQNQTSKLLTKLHHNYTQIKPTIIMKHRMVESYLKQHIHTPK